MITKLTGDTMPPRIPVCKTDFEIWDLVLGRRPGWKLETMSHSLDRADAAAMFAATDASGEP